ncbi:MAG: TrkH family potassium uptake protein [Syntrophomonadaceae bacterium]|nr:TrkH family potassium uptake protein [Syntrophomonadaceae bacterium]MDD3889685.1 TrkH family potassium uptake protein [Syntrophomonadaceae bacterium]MDD4549836.1 TrkH family potassium uptake protein [Syntrophomonadaceae bacterium]
MIRPAVVLNYIGKIVVIIGIAMMTSVFWSIYYQEEIIWRIVLAALITIIAGLLLSRIDKHGKSLNYREGFAVVTLGWVAASFFGTLPFLLSGYMPSFADAIFETVSGFTTTGATILTDVEALPKSLLFWRSLTQWLGGMGIMALFIAIIVGMGTRANQIFRAEIPGPVSDKISPRIRETAKILWTTYVVMSVVLFFLLYIFGMDVFDAFCHTFSTMATGGFSTKNQSVGFYSSPYIQWTIIIFMFIAGTNFSLHYFAYKKRSLKGYIQNREFKLYSGIILVAAALCAVGMSQIPAMEEKIRTSLFQVVSIITTTGYGTADYDQWSALGKSVILILMFIGGCAGSTSGNIKVGRHLIMLQRAAIEIKKMIHPKALIPVRLGGRVISIDLVVNVLQFFFIYMAIIFIGTITMGAMGLDLLSGFSAVATCLGNVGPGFGLVGPTQNFGFMPDVGKYILSLLMLLGRLEIYPVLVLLMPSYWKE